jgi:beta-1,4-N-acetylglucosaminyltransferase
MLVLLDHLDKRFYAPRIYVSAATDALSATKAAARERRWAEEEEEEERQAGAGARRQQRRRRPSDDYACVTIPRSREVGQAWLSSALTTARACLHALALVWRERPALLLANGPGTCVPLCAAAALLRAAGASRTRVAYVESVARVRRLSLSARLLGALRLADVLLVQWPALAEEEGRGAGGGGGAAAGRAECAGRLF